jgi:hypothetical protein
MGNLRPGHEPARDFFGIAAGHVTGWQTSFSRLIRGAAGGTGGARHVATVAYRRWIIHGRKARDSGLTGIIALLPALDSSLLWSLK